MSHIPTAAHDSWARYYDFVNEQSFGSALTDMTETILDRVEELVPPGGRITDYGAGTGRLALPLARLGYRVTAVEPSPAMAAELRAKAERAGVDLQVEMSRLQSFIPTERGHMALAVFTVLAYLLDGDALARAASGMRASVHTGGHALIDVPTAGLFGPIHYRTPVLDRRVTITSSGGECYRYAEECSGCMAGEDFRYTDAFSIRAWAPEEVVENFARAGWSCRENLSSQFEGSGSRYFLLQAIG